jgi:hypothetical protein
VVTVVLLLIAKRRYPNPEEFEPPAKDRALSMNRSFIFYIIAISLLPPVFWTLP